MAKLAELKDQVTGYNIFDDLLNDVLKPALGKAIENLIPTIQKHLGDLIGKLVPSEYISIADVVDATSVIKDIFEQVKAKIEEAKPVVAEILGQMKAAVEDMIAKVQAGIEQVKPVLQELVEKIMAKIAELHDKLIGGYNIFDDLLNDVLKPALGKAIENLIPTIQKHLGDLIGKLVP